MTAGRHVDGRVVSWLGSPDWPMPAGWTPAPDPGWDGSQACLDRTDWTDGSGTADKRRVCGVCPFMGPCLAWALTHNEHGVWGGLTRGERVAVVLSFRPVAS